MVDVAAADSIRVNMNYLDKNGIFYNLAHSEVTQTTIAHEVEVRNARLIGDRLDLDTHGFELVEQHSALDQLQDSEEARTAYLGELADFIREKMGTDCVHMLQVAVRSVDGEKRGGREPVRMAHCDHPEESWRVYAKMAMGEEEAERRLSSNRWLVLNLWRGLRPVENWLLAICDGSTVDEKHFETTLTYDKPGGTESPFRGRPLRFSPAHRWYYFPHMQPEELMVFKQYDSAAMPARWAPHSAVVDPTSAPDSPPRASIEARALVCF